MKKYNPNNYLGVDSDGVTQCIPLLTKKELQQNLCMSMHALERIENNMSVIADVINDWRESKLEPDDEE